MPAVGLRAACPCGSGRRYKACHGARSRPAPVLRPFAGRSDEPDLVALRELVPSASAPLALSAAYLAAHPEHADRRIILGTILPQGVPALVRDDTAVLVAMQTAVSGLDPSADVAAALLAALDAPAGTVVTTSPASALLEIERRPERFDSLPRLTDILDPAPVHVTVHRGFEWWLPASDADADGDGDGDGGSGTDPAAVAGSTPVAGQPAPEDGHPVADGEVAERDVHSHPAGSGADADVARSDGGGVGEDDPEYGPQPVHVENPELAAALERANGSIVPTERLSSVEAAYWCNQGERWHLRWVMPHPEEELLDALARIAAAGALTVGDGSRFAGAFRAGGLLVPVWDLAPDAPPQSCEEPAAALRAELDRVLADPRPLTTTERRVRAGLVARSLTLR